MDFAYCLFCIMYLDSFCNLPPPDFRRVRINFDCGSSSFLLAVVQRKPADRIICRGKAPGLIRELKWKVFFYFPWNPRKTVADCMMKAVLQLDQCSTTEVDELVVLIE